VAVQKKNLAIARSNAARWWSNLKIGDAANKTRAEEEFYIRYNFDNVTGEMSNNLRTTNDQIISGLVSRNIRGATSKQLLRQSLESARRGITTSKLQTEGALISAKRKHENTLSQRNFGYNEAITYIPQPVPDPNIGGIWAASMAQGIMSATASGIAGQRSQDLAAKQGTYMDAQMDYMGRQSDYTGQRISNINTESNYVQSLLGLVP
jgi:hypothetical protein